MLATYVSANQFTVSTDRTAEFVTGRRIKANCGGDGIKYSTVESSYYSNPNTYVTINESVLTVNLNDILYGIANVGEQGSLPDHLHNSSEGEGGLIQFINLSDTPTTYSGTDNYYAVSTGSGIEFIQGNYATGDDLTTLSGNLSNDLSNHISSGDHDGRYYTETEVDNLITALSGTYLRKDNTVPFTPDADYEPATKKYVDDIISTVSGSSATQTGKQSVKVEYNSDNSVYLNPGEVDVYGTSVSISSRTEYSLQTTASSTISSGIWYYGAVTYDSTSEVQTDYINGSATASGTHTGLGAIETNTNDFGIGYNPVVGTDSCCKGIVEEVRVSSTARSAAWLKATYNILSNSLLTYSAGESYIWDSAKTSSNFDLSNSDRTLTCNTAGTGQSAISNWTVDSGKWYWEIKAVNMAEYSSMGICYQGTGTDFSKTIRTGWNESWAIYDVTGSTIRKYHDGSIINSFSGEIFEDDDIVMFALDVDNHKLWVGQNGTWLDSGDPANDTNPFIEDSTITGEISATITLRYVDDEATAQFLGSEQTYSAPSGFSTFSAGSPNYTINQSLIDSDLINFPVGIKIESSTGFMSDFGPNDWQYIHVTVTGTECYTEVEYWDTVNDEAVLWAKVPLVTSNSGTVITVASGALNTSYIGETGDSAAQNVWDSNYAAVYHMHNDPSGGSNCILDSTSNLNYGTPSGTMVSGSLVDGSFGKAIEFDGVDDGIYVTGSGSLQVSTGLTLEVYHKDLGTTKENAVYAAKEQSYLWTATDEFVLTALGKLYLSSAWRTLSPPLSFNTWYYIYINSSGEVINSTDAPTIDYVNLGYYDNNYRCIGFVLADNDGDITKFSTSRGNYVFVPNVTNLSYTASNITTAGTVVTHSVPMGDTIVNTYLLNSGTNSIDAYVTGDSSNVWSELLTDGVKGVTNVALPCSANKQITYVGNGGNTTGAVKTNGFVIPDYIYTSA